MVTVEIIAQFGLLANCPFGMESKLFAQEINHEGAKITKIHEG
jgi:hypothetical protein